MKIFSTILFFVITLLTTSLFYNCSDNSGSGNSDVSGQLINYDGCKYIDSEALFKGNYAPSYQDCIEYQFDSTGSLTVTHINAAFNCCPADIIADIQSNGNAITITEQETNAPCDCICLYDVEYRFSNVTADIYTITINGLYLGNTNPIQVQIDLTNSPFDTFCIPRDIYPWRTN